MNRSNLAKLLLTSTLLTACGDTPTEPERKAAQGITSDGTAGEIPTIQGEQTQSFVSEFVRKNQPQINELKVKLANSEKEIQEFADTFPGESVISATKANTDRFKELLVRNIEVGAELYKLQSALYPVALENFRQFDVKGDLTVVKDPQTPWETLGKVSASLRIFEEPIKELNRYLALPPENNSRKKKLAQLSDVLDKQHPQLLRPLAEAGYAKYDAEQAYKKIINGGEAGTRVENIKVLKSAVSSAISKRVQKLFFTNIVSEDTPDTVKETVSTTNTQLMTNIRTSMKQKGFLNTRGIKNPDMYDLMALEPFDDEPQSEAQKVTSTLAVEYNVLTHNILKTSLSTNTLSDDDYISMFIGERGIGLSSMFTVSNAALKRAGIPYGAFTILGSLPPHSSPTQHQGVMCLVSNEGGEASLVHVRLDGNRLVVDSRGSAQITQQQTTSIAKQAYKAFVSTLIPLPEFKGVFDFLKEADGFKDDAEFMALFTPTATALSRGAIGTLSSALGLAARTHTTGIDASAFTLNGTSGDVTQLDLPIHLSLTGAMSNGAITHNTSATASYHINNATSLAVQHAYANSGKGFGVNSYQNETSAIVNHAFNNMLFVEGGFGYVDANNVHNSLWNGVQTYFKLGADIASGKVSPFIQVTHKHLNQDNEYTLNHTGYTVGLNSIVANLTTHAYTLNATVGASATYVNHHWATTATPIGDTQLIETELSTRVNLNLNSGVGFNSHVSLTPNNTSVGFSINMNY